ncbi:MAG TPA: nucleotidyltransferase family protein [Candidatus Angelobacter sp.]|nr:nucleotidyltransferase family protein [Candidatus Angelobacter sp.]
MGPLMPGDLFRRLSVLLEQAGIPYMLTGSFASTVYGMARSTADIDFIIAADEEHIRKLMSLLPEEDFYSELGGALESCRRRSMFNVIDNATSLKVDFIFLKNRDFSREEFQRRNKAQVEGVELYIATPEDIILSKLEWAKRGASLRQIEDVVGILKVRNDQLDLAYIGKWVNELGLQAEWSNAIKMSAPVQDEK